MKIFLTTLIPLFSIFIFSCFSYLEQLEDDLCHAAEADDVKMVERILSRGIAPNYSCRIFSKTPLHFAAFKNSTETAQLLLERGAEIEARDIHNITPLHDAALNNSRETVQLLLEHGAEI